MGIRITGEWLSRGLEHKVRVSKQLHDLSGLLDELSQRTIQILAFAAE
jgi:hypothetical protein